MTIRLRLMSSVATVCVACVLTFAPAFAQDSARLDALEKRMDAMDTKIDAIMDRLGQQSGANTDKSAPAADAAASPGEDSGAVVPGDLSTSDLKPGMTLDLYTLNWSGDWKQIGVKATAQPSGTPSASEVVKANGSFGWGDFLDLASMARFGQPMDRQVGLLWSGLMQVEQEGNHSLQLEVTNERGSNTGYCVGSVSIDEQLVVRTDLETKNRSSSNLEIGDVSLASGLHRFALWGSCISHSGTRNKTNFGGVHFNVLMKRPLDRAPIPIDPSLFFVKS